MQSIETKWNIVWNGLRTYRISSNKHPRCLFNFQKIKLRHIKDGGIIYIKFQNIIIITIIIIIIIIIIVIIITLFIPGLKVYTIINLKNVEK